MPQAWLHIITCRCSMRVRLAVHAHSSSLCARAAARSIRYTSRARACASMPYEKSVRCNEHPT
eukprot:6208742-Pleurochrysis_carterae.AAC.1